MCNLAATQDSWALGKTNKKEKKKIRTVLVLEHHVCPFQPKSQKIMQPSLLYRTAYRAYIL